MRTTAGLTNGCRLAAVLLLVPGSPAWPAERFVSPTGDDDAPGTRARPWKTADKAGAAAQAGDVVTFLPGEYAGQLLVRNDGRPGEPIVFRGAEQRRSRLVGGNPVIRLEDRRHVVIDGLRVEPRHGTFIRAARCEDIALSNCRFEGGGASYTVALFDKCRRVHLRANVFNRLLSVRKGAVLVGNMIQANHCDRLVIEGNTISRAGHSPAHLRECTHLVVRRNLFCAKWGRGFETFNAEPMLFEENVVTEEVDSGGSADSRGKVMSIDGIFRRNLIVRNYDMALASNSYIYRPTMPAWVLRRTRLYNNTLYLNHTYSWIVTAMRSDLSTVSGNIWKNNIFYMNDPLGEHRALRIGHMGEGNRFVHNALHGDRPGRKLADKWNGKRYQRYTLAEAEESLGALFSDNLEVAPRFVDAEADDYRLAAGCPCIDAGDFLARTSRAGAGRVLPVDDARWFYDGFGIEGQTPDLVFVGAERGLAKVVRVDRKANVLHLDRELRWRAGDPVSPPYTGKAPDLGAMEHGAEGEAWFHRITVPAGIRWRPPTDPKAPLVASDFEDATLEQWGFVWNLDRKRNTSYERVKDTAAGGAYSLRLFATEDKAILAGDVKPPVWEIDRYPIVRFAYRIPKGVPVGVWLDGFDTEAWGMGRVCMGGTPARHTAGNPDLKCVRLVDDDQWHSVSFDARLVRKALAGVRHLQGFQFYTHRNAKKGQCFWVDDFAISPE